MTTHFQFTNYWDRETSAYIPGYDPMRSHVGRNQWTEFEASEGYRAPPSISPPERDDSDSPFDRREELAEYYDEVDAWKAEFGQDAWDAYIVNNNEIAGERRRETGDDTDRWKAGMALTAAASFGAASFGGGGVTSAPAVGGTEALTGVTVPSSAYTGSATAGLGATVPASAYTGSASAAAAEAAGMAPTLGGVASTGAEILSGVGSGVTTAAAGAASNWWEPALGAGLSLLGGAAQYSAAGDATDAQLEANRESLDYLGESRDLALELAAPYREASLGALGQMQEMTTPGGDFDVTTDPGYQFRLDEGMRALENSAAARGRLLSGGFSRESTRYAQGVASQEYMNIYNRLGVVAGYQQVGNEMSAVTQAGQGASGISNVSGLARGSGYLAQGNAIQNSLQQIAEIDWSGVFGSNQ